MSERDKLHAALQQLLLGDRGQEVRIAVSPVSTSADCTDDDRRDQRTSGQNQQLVQKKRPRQAARKTTYYVRKVRCRNDSVLGRLEQIRFLARSPVKLT